MRRGELLKLPELKVTETMRKTVGEDQGHQVLRCGRAPVWSATYYWFYRAKKTGTVLEIDVFTRDMILNDTRYPKYRVFLLGENKYYTYDNLCEKWRTAKIDNLSYWEGWGEIEEGYWYSSGKVWIREGDRKRITEFCHNGKVSYLELAKTFEQTFYPEGRKTSDSEAYERVYQMPLREKKEREVLKTEPLKKKAEPAKAQETLEEPKETEEQIPGQMEVEDYPELMPDAPAMNLPEEEKQVHEITEEVVQEGEVIEDILKSGDPEKIMQLLKKEFAWPKGGWDNWKKKVITL